MSGTSTTSIFKGTIGASREAWLKLSALADALVGLSKEQTTDIRPVSLQQFHDLRVLLKSTRLALLGIHYIADDET